MKKLPAIICIVLLLFALTACEPSNFLFDYDELKATVVRAEYIYYDNPNAVELNEFIFNKHDRLLPFDFDKMEIRAVLPNEKLDEFLKDLSDWEIMMHWVHDDSPHGECLRVIYNNGDFEVLSSSEGAYAGSFYANGEVKRFIGRGNHEVLLSRWFNVQE